jgi:hypothetical protein
LVVNNVVQITINPAYLRKILLDITISALLYVELILQVFMMIWFIAVVCIKEYALG